MRSFGSFGGRRRRETPAGGEGRRCSAYRHGGVGYRFTQELKRADGLYRLVVVGEETCDSIRPLARFAQAGHSRTVSIDARRFSTISV
jgi:hypothetical protein